ncbi:MAG: hypothetical protein V4696_10705 [Pseudomonadota bacterium]
MSEPEPPSGQIENAPYAPAYDATGFDQRGYESTPLNFRHPHWIEEDRAPLDVLYTAEGFPVIDFTPVPQVRRRRNGWDAIRQRAFVAWLSHTPSIAFAARKVGLSPQSYYRLLERPGAESFAKAVDIAIDHGLMQLRLSSAQRGLIGEDEVPVFRRGRHVRTELRRNDRLAMALLRQADADPDRLRHAAQLRWRGKREQAAMDAAQAADRAAEKARAADYAAALELCLKPRPRMPSIRPL